jgi:hypothetical protein
VSDSGEGFAFKTWKHVAITVKSSSESPAIITVAIYYDGEKKTTAGEINLPAASTNFTTNFIGKGTKVISKDSGLDAYLNDVKIFNSALSATQVSSQYTSEKCNDFYSRS